MFRTLNSLGGIERVDEGKDEGGGTRVTFIPVGLTAFPTT